MPAGSPLRPELRILSLSSSGSSGSGHVHDAAAGAAAEPGAGTAAAAAGAQSKQQQLCGGCVERASDALAVKGYSHYLPSDYCLVPSYGNEFALLSAGMAPSKRSSGSSRSVRQKQQQRQQQAPSPSQQQQRGSGAAAKQQQAAAADADAAAAAASGGEQEAVVTAAGDDEGAAADGGAAEVDAAAGDAAEVDSDLLEDFREFMYFIVSPQVGGWGVTPVGGSHQPRVPSLALDATISVSTRLSGPVTHQPRRTNRTNRHSAFSLPCHTGRRHRPPP